MTRISFAALAAIAFAASGCASRAESIHPRILAAADPAAPESPYSPPEDALGSQRPRALGIEIDDPTTMHHAEKAPEIGTPDEHGGEDHSQHGGSSSPTPKPKPSPTKKATPTPTPRAPEQGEHDHGATTETIYACPMHPEVRDTKPGKCPKCGMTLEPVKEDK